MLRRISGRSSSYPNLLTAPPHAVSLWPHHHPSIQCGDCRDHRENSRASAGGDRASSPLLAQALVRVDAATGPTCAAPKGHGIGCRYLRCSSPAPTHKGFWAFSLIATPVEVAAELRTSDTADGPGGVLPARAPIDRKVVACHLPERPGTTTRTCCTPWRRGS
jgi:hypothetical protein